MLLKSYQARLLCVKYFYIAERLSSGFLYVSSRHVTASVEPKALLSFSSYEQARTGQDTSRRPEETDRFQFLGFSAKLTDHSASRHCDV